MSFERFGAGGARWEDQPASPPAIGEMRDPRIHDVLNAIEQMEMQKRPRALTEQQWFLLLRDVRHLADKWLDIALLCDWPLPRLFGVPRQPRGHVGLFGVAPILRGRPIESIDHDRIAIANRLGAPNVIWRQPPGASAPLGMTGSVLAWDAVNMEGWA